MGETGNFNVSGDLLKYARCNGPVHEIQPGFYEDLYFGRSVALTIFHAVAKGVAGELGAKK